MVALWVQGQWLGLAVLGGIAFLLATIWFVLTQTLCVVGDVNAARGNYAQAVRCYTLAEKFYCRWARLYSNRGKVFYYTGDREQAARDFDRSLQIQPRQAEAYLGRGTILMKAGQNEAALQDYDLAIEYQPQLAEAYCSRGIIQQRLGDWAAAQVDFQQAIQLKPHFFHPYYYLSLVQVQLADLVAAQATVAQAIQLRPQYPPLHYLQGKIAFDLTDPATAVQSFARGQEWEPPTAANSTTGGSGDRYPNDEYGYCYRGWVKQHQGDRPAANNDWLTAQRLAELHQNQPLLSQLKRWLEEEPETVSN